MSPLEGVGTSCGIGCSALGTTISTSSDCPSLPIYIAPSHFVPRVDSAEREFVDLTPHGPPTVNLDMFLTF